MFLFKLIPMILTQVTSALFQPLFWLVAAFIAYQHWQTQRLQIDMFGKAKYTMPQILKHALGYGFTGGLLGSFMLVMVGIPLNNLGIEYLWPVALLLALLHIRYLCFAYAGGLVGVAGVIFGWPQVYVPGLIALVAVLHITESILIAISGARGATPIILRTKQGKVVGGFQLQNLWPLPLVLLWSDLKMETMQDLAAGVYLQMPSWWPVFQSGLQIPPGHAVVYTLTTVIAALGYADRAVATHPALRRQQSAKHLFLYSSALLLIAIASRAHSVLQIIAALCAPIGHELLLWLDSRREHKGAPLFRPVPDGVMVLDVYPGTMAEKFGLKSGDVIRMVNGRPVYRRDDIGEALRNGGDRVNIVCESAAGIRQTGGVFPPGGILGVITVPEGHETCYVEIRQGGAPERIKRLWERIKRGLRD